VNGSGESKETGVGGLRLSWYRHYGVEYRLLGPPNGVGGWRISKKFRGLTAHESSICSVGWIQKKNMINVSDP
jgi:hypothetical protein